MASDAADEDDELSDSDEFLRAVARAPDVAPESAPSSSREPLLDRLAHFRILDKLGRGGMGIVYRAEDEKLERVVALKILAGDFDDDPARRRRFLREAKLAASITHANVATVHEIGEAEGRIYIAMELVDGTTLRRRLEDAPREQRGLSISESHRIAKEIARGVAQAHARGIAHRDLKPDNVMVASDGGVKVLDFGLAKPTEVSSTTHADADEPATLTQEGRIMGTPGYMSPEQATGRPLDVRSDVFSLGVVLYEMLSGTRPFVGETPMDIVIATSRDVPVPLASRNPNVPPGLARVVDRSMAKDPNDRFANAQEMLAALEAIDLRETGAPRRSSARYVSVLVGALLISAALAWRIQSPSRSTLAPEAPSATTTLAAAAPVPSFTSALVAEVAPTHGESATPSPSATPLPSKPIVSARITDPRPARAAAPSAAPRASSSAAPSASSRSGVIQVSPY